MSRFLVTILVISFVFFKGGICFAEPSRPPNIVVIVADDLGWAELACYGNRFNETPNLDRMASEGMRFTAAYAAAPVCSPWRAAFLTGQFPARVGITDYLRADSSDALSTSHLTIAERMQNAGYVTGMIGKWHLSGYRFHGAEVEIRPTAHGFGTEFAAEVKSVGNGANFWPYVFRDQPIPWVDITKPRLGEKENLTDRMNLEAVEFIERNAARPFFLYLSHYAPHTILNGKESLVAKYRDKHQPGPSTRQRCYLCQDAGHEGDSLNHWAGDHNPHLAAMLESIDEGVGQILNKLDALQLSEQTLVIFTSDNGGETNVTSNAPLRGGKSELYEGGIRVPLLARWRDQIPSPSICAAPVTNIDFYPTFLEAAQLEPDASQHLDGVSVLPELLDAVPASSPRTLFWHYPLPQRHFLGGRSAGAIREGDWKLIEFFDTGQRELFNLTQDLSETSEVGQKYPEVASHLYDRLRKWRNDLNLTGGAEALLCIPLEQVFEERFAPPVSERWFFRKHWMVQDEVLQLTDAPGNNQRIFLRQTRFRNAILEIDFAFQGAQEIRVMTGTPGKYNAVVIITPSGLQVTTAADPSVPFYPTIHGECAVDLSDGSWHRLMIEFCADEIHVRLDGEISMVGRHPILDRERDYFALQVDQPAASFDNICIRTAEDYPTRAWKSLRPHLERKQKSFPPLTLERSQQFANLKRIQHDALYRRDVRYRELVQQVDEFKVIAKERYPQVFRTMKEARKQIARERQILLETVPAFRMLQEEIQRAKRETVVWLKQKEEGLGALPAERYEAELEFARRKWSDDADYRRIAERVATLTLQQQADYPQLFKTNSQLLEENRAERLKVADTADFKELMQQQAVAFRTSQRYLLESDAELKRLHEDEFSHE
ncbi:MAG: sulfatase-like hydrolase/transferase [Pirellulaceae bacterium]|nr:sulfatase-like hydrolase/transferase [Pirellulaceae bacterium]